MIQSLGVHMRCFRTIDKEERTKMSLIRGKTIGASQRYTSVRTV